MLKLGRNKRGLKGKHNENLLTERINQLHSMDIKQQFARERKGSSKASCSTLFNPVFCLSAGCIQQSSELSE